MLNESRLIRAYRRQVTDVTPVWFMRQAGRYMPEYRAIREKVSMLDAIRTPEIAYQITMQPVNAFNIDAAILFADILTPLIGMGLSLDFVGGEGPQIANPIRVAEDVDRLKTPPAEEVMPFAFEAIRMAVADLTPRGLPLIGFAGAPFTLASYAIEGGGSKQYERTKGMMYAEPAVWEHLMRKLTAVIGEYLVKQAEAGASALQIFDSWAGALSPQDYARFALPYTQTLVETAQRTGVPVIYFSTGTNAMLDQIAAVGSDVISVDWRISLDRAWTQIGTNRAIQGNLDPVTLFAPWSEVCEQTKRILREADGRPGHVFNLGHGILPGTPVDTVRRLADFVHEHTVKSIQSMP